MDSAGTQEVVSVNVRGRPRVTGRSATLVKKVAWLNRPALTANADKEQQAKQEKEKVT